MTVTGDCVLNRDLEDFVFRAREFQAAVVFARIVPAVDEFSFGLRG